MGAAKKVTAIGNGEVEFVKSPGVDWELFNLILMNLERKCAAGALLVLEGLDIPDLPKLQNITTGPDMGIF